MVKKKVEKVDEAARAVTAASAVNAGAVATEKEALVVEAGKEQQEGVAKDEEVADAEFLQDQEEEEEAEGEEKVGLMAKGQRDLFSIRGPHEKCDHNPPWYKQR